MPHPGAGFPIPAFQWPHVGRQWPAWNIESDQAEGLQAWWPTLASKDAPILRDMLADRDGSIPTGWGWGYDSVAGPYISVPGTGAAPGIRPSDGASLGGWAATTIAVWCRLNTGSAPDYPGILAKNGCYAMAYQHSTANLYFSITGTGGGTGWINHVSSHNVDHLYVLTYDSADAKLYEDGIYIKTDSDASGPVVDNANGLYIGEREFGAAFMLGRFYEARFYNRAFNASQNWQLQDPATRWELYQIPRHVWRLGVVAPPPAGQPIHLRALNIPHMRQWQPGRR